MFSFSDHCSNLFGRNKLTHKLHTHKKRHEPSEDGHEAETLSNKLVNLPTFVHMVHYRMRLTKSMWIKQSQVLVHFELVVLEEKGYLIIYMKNCKAGVARYLTKMKIQKNQNVLFLIM